MTSMVEAGIRRLTQDASCYPVDGGAIVYHGAAQRIFALNDSAALVWLQIRDGLSTKDIARLFADRFDLSDDEAQQWVVSALNFFGAEDFGRETRPNMSRALPTDVAVLAIDGIDYSVLGRIVRIAAPNHVQSWIDSLLGLLRHDADLRTVPDAILTIGRSQNGYEIRTGEDFAYAADELYLTAAVEKAIIENVVPLVPHIMSFHAALLTKGGRAILFPAASGSGKTTLSAKLATRGWAYGSDEMAFLDRDRQWQGLPFPPCIKSTNYPMIETLHGGLQAAQEHERFGRTIKYLPLASTAPRAGVRLVVFPRYDSQSELAVAPIQPLDGLARLLSQCIYVPPGLDEADVHALIVWHEQVAYFDMTFRDLDSASDWLDTMIGKS